jgi:hypothetical protein
MFKYLALSGLLLFSACFSSKKSTKTSNFQYGQTRDEVLKNIHGRTELMVAEFEYPQGHLVAYQYSRIGRTASQDGQYYLYFMNDTLIRRSDPEDLEAGAKIGVKEYYKKKKEMEARRLEMQERKQEQEARREEQARKREEYKSQKKDEPKKKTRHRRR